MDRDWGVIKSDNVTWSGIVGDLVAGKIDISSTGLGHTLQRDYSIMFGLTLFNYIVTLIQPTTTAVEINVWVYLTIFPLLAWIILIVMVLFASVLFGSITNYNKSSDGSKIDGFFIPLNYLLQLAHGKALKLRTKAAKVGLISWGMGCYLLLSMYAADLTATMTSGPPDSNIKSVYTGYQCETLHS